MFPITFAFKLRFHFLAAGFIFTELRIPALLSPSQDGRCIFVDEADMAAKLADAKMKPCVQKAIEGLRAIKSPEFCVTQLIRVWVFPLLIWKHLAGGIALFR